MPMVYITDQAKEHLDRLATAEKRSLSMEMEFVLALRIKELGLPDLNQTSNVPNRLPKTQMSCQGVNHV